MADIDIYFEAKIQFLGRKLNMTLLHRNFTTHFNSEHTAESANKLENIKAGFPSTRTMETINSKYVELQQHPMVLKGKPYLSVPPDVRNGSTGPSAGRGIFFISAFSGHADLQASNFCCCFLFI